MGTLYIVATPIGNMEDITLRAIRILGTVQIIACEDTRKTGLLLKRLAIINKPRLLSYYEENELGRIPQIVSLLKQNQDVALVSNAGTPTVSDPGFKLVRECLKENIKIVSLPGPSSVIASLVTSGLPTDKFIFLGYLPRKLIKRQKIWNYLTTALQCTIGLTVILFESPHRLIKTVSEIKEVIGDINIVVCQELTKIYEKTISEKASEVIQRFDKNKPRGEFTILFNTLQE